jgi:DNA repair exonuclease SbcCD ATPase subunit
MKIEFRQLAIEHFGSFAEKQLLKLTPLDVGVHFVRGVNEVEKIGPNGAGKSKMVNALAWCLYGRTTDNLKAVDVKPWSGTGKPRVSLFAHFDGKKHKVTRTAPNFLELDGKEVSQEEIDNLMHMNYGVFKQAVIFGQTEPLFFDLANKDKLALLSEVLELDKWEVRSQKASERTRELETREGELRSKLTTLETTITKMRELVAMTIRARDAWEEELAAKLKNANKDKRLLAHQLAEAEKKLKTATRIGISAAEKLGELQADLKIAEDYLAKYNQKLSVLNERNRQLTSQYETVEKELADLDKARRCPTCNQPITRVNVRTHRAHLQDRLKQLDKQVKETTVAKGPETNNLILKYKNDVIMNRARMVTYQTEVDARTREVAAANTARVECKARLEAIDRLMSEREAEANPHTDQLKKFKAQLTEFKAESLIAGKAADKASRQAVRSKYWIKGFKDVRLFVIEDVLQELELTTTALLEDMGLLGWQVNYAVERETKSGSIQTGMTISILSPRNKKPVKWESWSGGEGQRLRLAGALALSEVLLGYANIEVNLEILDEPTKHLSDEGVVDLCEMLTARSEQLGRKILYIDHMAQESSQFASTIVVRKTKEGSFIEQD